MLKYVMAALGLGGMMAASPAVASVEGLPDIRPHAHSIEALEDLAWRYPALKAGVKLELAKFDVMAANERSRIECAAGMQWRCGADGHPASSERKGYGG